MAHRRIAIVTCSTRKPRVNPFVSGYVHKILAPLNLQPNTTSLEILDIGDQKLPLLDEPGIPAHYPANDPTPHYQHAHTRAWSTKVRSFDAFIFVTPQYNRSVPPSLKNAIDFLFHEWVGKPAAVVTYGGHGGGFCAKHLQDILPGLKCQMVEPMVALTMYDNSIEKCEEIGEIEPRIAEKWKEEGKECELKALFEDLVKKLETKEEKN